MKASLSIIIVIILSSACAAATDQISTNKLTLVKENHSTLSINNVEYILDSYIVLFQVPYYIKPKRSDGATIEKNTAIAVAREYIQPRGCTAPISRRPDLDQNSADKTQWLIGIEC